VVSWKLKRRSKPKISFPLSFRLSAGGEGGAAKNGRKFLGLPRDRRGRVRGANHHASGAYASVPSHHVLGAWKGQSLRDWKKVRAKVRMSAPANFTIGARTVQGRMGQKPVEVRALSRPPRKEGEACFVRLCYCVA